MFHTLNSFIHTAHTPTFLLSKRPSPAYTLSYRHYPLLCFCVNMNTIRYCRHTVLTVSYINTTDWIVLLNFDGYVHLTQNNGRFVLYQAYRKLWYYFRFPQIANRVCVCVCQTSLVCSVDPHCTISNVQAVDRTSKLQKFSGKKSGTVKSIYMYMVLFFIA